MIAGYLSARRFCSSTLLSSCLRIFTLMHGGTITRLGCSLIGSLMSARRLKTLLECTLAGFRNAGDHTNRRPGGGQALVQRVIMQVAGGRFRRFPAIRCRHDE